MGGKNAAARAASKADKQQSASAAKTAETVKQNSGQHALICVQDANTQYVFAMQCTENATLPYRYTCKHHILSLKKTPSPEQMTMPTHGLTFAFMTLYALDLEISPGKLCKKALDAGWNRHVEMTGDIAYIPKERNAAYPSSSMIQEQLVQELGMQKDSIVRVERVQTTAMLIEKCASIEAPCLINCCYAGIFCNCRVYVVD